MSQTNRILTTHTGSLPRPADLHEMMLAMDRGEAHDGTALQRRIPEAIAQVVKRQVDLGIDVVSDGEYSKTSYTAYVKDRLNGFEGEQRQVSSIGLYKDEFPDFTRIPGNQVFTPSNDGPVTLRDSSAVRRDIAVLKAAADAAKPTGVFMTAPSPGQISRFMPTSFYQREEDYLHALASAMRDEYQAIVEAGFTLQLDCPDLASGRSNQLLNLSDDEFRKQAALHIAVVNEATAGLPRERLRLHICWGNYEGPHNHDLELKEIVDVLIQANVGALLFEAANHRHAHEWKVWRNVPLPAGTKLIPGVIDSCSNYVEHPELVAERLVRFADIVGPENVLAGTDCGFGTSLGVRHVAPSVAWAKLGSMVEGARLASKELWG